MEVLSCLGIDAVNCANNHCLDYGPDALAESVGHLRSSGVAVIGLATPDSEPLVKEVRGVRLGLLGFTDDWRHVGPPSARARPAGHQEAVVRSQIAAAKARCDVVAVQLR